jgi:2,4-dienoyl-CoA reductase-like NADH-dependent reductase (Old Yellow Enzyme family)
MMRRVIVKVGHLKSIESLRAHLQTLGAHLPIDERALGAQESSPLAEAIDVDGFRIGNRWCAHPMEGWDGTREGEASEHTIRRWKHFGESGAKLIWGGEAFAVREDGRANLNQLGIVDGDIARAEKTLAKLIETLRSAHREKFGRDDDLMIGLQLTHSGRFAKPQASAVYEHPLLPAAPLLGDDEIERIIDCFVVAAKIAQRVGFHFVDVKHCHGYLGHEFLSAFTRPGKFGGSFENRTRFAREIIERIRGDCRGLGVGVRLSAFDEPPFRRDALPIPYRFGFGCRQDDPFRFDLSEPIEFIHMLGQMNVRLINVSCGSPYYNPHIQRPAMFPPSDGYPPPEDPLVGVARQMKVVRELKRACPDSIFVGSGYTYLQEFLPHVAQAAVREGWTDFVGIGRLLLSYWELPADLLAGRAMQAKRLCRTFSDCTTAPRNGLISGCYPLDPHYKNSPQHVQLKTKKGDARR